MFVLVFLSSNAYSAADQDPPLLKLVSGGGIFAQGKTAMLYFTSTKPDINIDGVFQGKDFKAYPYVMPASKPGIWYRAVIGFSIDDPGNVPYYMKIRASDKEGNKSDYHYKVFVKKTKFQTLRFTMHPKKVMMLMPDTIREDWKKIEDFVSVEDPHKYYSGRFIRPAGGRISMLFGTNEYVNGEESGKHRGLDFANPMGAKVWASNSGIVRLAERLPAHGNCVVIDHGQGVFTYYAHLSKILVKPGDAVKKGENIGLVGMTGVATGPHLHFSVSLHNLRVDPLQWLKGVVTD